jgi:addiction module HigA family antidote
VAHPVDLLVDRAFLLHVGVCAGHIGLGLVVIVVGHEILDRVVREEALHLAVELGGQSLVGGQDQGRPGQRLDHVGHGEGLARTGDPQEHLVALGLGEAGDQLLDGLRLIARRREVGGQIKGPAIQLVRQRRDRFEDRRGHGVYIVPSSPPGQGGVGRKRQVLCVAKEQAMSRSSTLTTEDELLTNPHPGEILLEEFMKPLAISQNALARAVHVSPRRINELVLGKRSVTADTDLRLARYFGVSEGFFLGLQADFDLMEHRREIESDLMGIDPRAA